MNDIEVGYKFLQSALTVTNTMNSLESILCWVKERNIEVSVEVNEINFFEMKQWYFDHLTKNFRHNSGKFFSIDGIVVETNWGEVKRWEQPIINQPEIGYLGFIVKEFDGVLYFLIQAKIEPGNVNNVQLSPTLQATKSNYTQVHKGTKPNYLEYFQRVKHKDILLDQLQSEQGARFLQKRNRNMIIYVNEDIEVKEDFMWLTLGQIKQLSNVDNIVNMDTRTVISGIPYGNYSSDAISLISLIDTSNRGFYSQILLNSLLNRRESLFSDREVFAWITDLKCKYYFSVEKKDILKLDSWEIGEKEISRKDNRFFKVIAAKVSISNREVSTWEQPLIKPAQSGIIGFITKKINGVLHFLVQAKLECGNFDTLELAPSVQCLTGSYENQRDAVPFLNYVLNAHKEQIIFDTMQSEEGGRFFREQNRNILIYVDHSFNPGLPENYIWLTLNQLSEFIKYNNYLNIQARSILSMLNFN